MNAQRCTDSCTTCNGFSEATCASRPDFIDCWDEAHYRDRLASKPLDGPCKPVPNRHTDRHTLRSQWRS